MKLRLHTPIPHPINLEFKHQPRTRYPHIEREIQIIKLDTLGRRQSRKQALGHAIQIRSKRAHIDQALAERIGRAFCVAGNEVVFDDEGLAGAEVTGVVEGYGS
jgi:hypothetical protein